MFFLGQVTPVIAALARIAPPATLMGTRSPVPARLTSPALSVTRLSHSTVTGWRELVRRTAGWRPESTPGTAQTSAELKGVQTIVAALMLT